ncbi:hybrid signal transduction histidine kinase M [Tanacetum coccineum]
MSKTLQQRLVVENPRSAKEAWDILADIFRDNKHTRSIALKAELRFLKLGDLTIDAYFRKLKSIATVLTSLESPMNSDDVVTFALESLPAKYDNVSTIIAHRGPFPDLKTVRSMLTTEEMRLKSREQDTLVDATSSSLMVLLANSGSNVRRSSSSMKKAVTSHLNDSVNNLSDIFNSSIYSSVAVGDGNSIPVTNSGLPNSSIAAPL